LSSHIPGYFDEEKINLGREVSNQVAIAITQNDLLRDLQKLNIELEQRVTERTSQLDTLNKELEAFAYSVSHDLRAPLRAIDGFTQILMEEYEPSLDDEGKRVCGVISRETVRMGKLIDDLLTFSRLSRREMHSSEIEMQSIVDSVFEELMSPEDKKRIDLKLEAVPPAMGDAALIRQVWINLLANAIKFTSRKKRAVIEVGGTQEAGELVYYVRDNGAGFEMDYVDKLFNVFQRLHGDSDFEGTGVGLAIVKRVIHRHGGRVWAQGKVDEGATFHFTLPQKEDENE
jgi:light-regulated signal transduction histidine kinase (bacteriophytochrome)